jgi:hypothetical protein
MEETQLEVFRYVSESLDKEETFHILGFEFLQRYNIVQLQNHLIAARESIYKDPTSSNSELKLLLRDYSTLPYVNIAPVTDLVVRSSNPGLQLYSRYATPGSSRDRPSEKSIEICLLVNNKPIPMDSSI